MASNTSGTLTASWAYDAFGNPAGAVAPSDVLTGWAGQTADPATGDWYLRARQYDPTTNQFESIDPLGGAAYQYADSDPLTYTDPAGLDVASGFGNFVVGIADVPTVGFVSRGLRAIGVSVDHCSGWYTLGKVAGITASLIALGGVASEAFAAQEVAEGLAANGGIDLTQVVGFVNPEGLSSAETATAGRMVAEVPSLQLSAFSEPSADVFDAVSGTEYELMGDPATSSYWSSQSENFMQQVSTHLMKGANFTVLDLTGFSEAQVAEVKEYIASLDPAQLEHLWLIGG